MSNHISVLLVGAGNMAREYCKVLQAQSIDVVVIGRGEEKARILEQEFHISVMTGGLTEGLRKLTSMPTHAIVTVNPIYLKDITNQLIEFGIKHILVEKPAGLCMSEVEEIATHAKDNGAFVQVAYNRRYYSSVKKAREIIEMDGGVDSFHFEFTEWSHVIEQLPKPKEELDGWLFANSTHVIDLAFFLGGEPSQMNSFVSGELAWHKSGSNYAGAGVSTKHALFTYQANWAAPGRWAVEVLTKKHRLYLKPMEQLAIQKIGSVAIDSVSLDDTLDTEFKPGLYAMVEDFILDRCDVRRVMIEEQVSHYHWFDQIAGL